MAGSFELKKTPTGKFRFNLKAGNGENILTSENYNSKASALNGIASVQKNCGDASKFVKATSKNGKLYFNLKAGNHQVIGTSQMYSSDSGCDNGIASVKKNGSTKTIKEL